MAVTRNEDIYPAGIGGQPEAFRTFALESTREIKSLRNALAKRRTELMVQVAEGYAKSWEEYKFRVGMISGLNEALAMCDEWEKEN
jgi:hypothetical protein